MKRGILVIGKHQPAIEKKASSLKLGYQSADDYEIPFDKTLITQSVRIPWDLLPAAWNFLQRWDAALPLYVHGVTAEQLGTDQERKITAKIIRDLRVLVYSHELLFVRKNETGQALIEQWKTEIQRGSDQRLAFLRAYYQIKPTLCVLPGSWLAEVRERSRQNSRRAHPRANQKRSRSPLVRVEISPGRFVKVHPEDKAEVLAKFQKER